MSLVLAFLVVGGVMIAGAELRDEASSTAASPAASTTVPSTDPPTTTTTTTTTLPPTTTTTTIPTALQQPPPATLPPVPLGGSLGPGSPDYVSISAYQQRLHDLKFDPGPIDGTYEQDMAYAVQAVQKIAGLARDGRIGAETQAALESFQYPLPAHPDAEGNRTEINIANQTITLYEGYQVKLITTTSTASGETFCYITPKKAPTQRVCEIATTPNGRYTYYFFYDGWQDGDLGELYNPYYFFKGRAIHGYDSVPAEPASHGCSRIPMHIATYWHTLVNRGDPVYVDGGPYDAEQIISSDPI